MADPHGIIAGADVTRAVSGPRTTFEFTVTFSGPTEHPDVVYRVWDAKRNQLLLHLEGALSAVPGSSAAAADPPRPAAADGAPADPPGFTAAELDVLRRWGGFASRPATDAGLLAGFGIEGSSVPPYFRDAARWFLQDGGAPTRAEFVLALGYLGGHAPPGSSPAPANAGNLASGPGADPAPAPPIRFWDGAAGGGAPLPPAPRHHVDDVAAQKAPVIRGIAGSPQVQAVLQAAHAARSGVDPGSRDLLGAEWERNAGSPTASMMRALENDGAVLARAVIESEAAAAAAASPGGGGPFPLTAVMITDSEGFNAVLSSMVPDYHQGDEKWWSEARASGIHVAWGAGGDFAGGSHVEVAMPVHGPDGAFLGVIKAQVDVSGIRSGAG